MPRCGVWLLRAIYSHAVLLDTWTTKKKKPAGQADRSDNQQESKYGKTAINERRKLSLSTNQPSNLSLSLSCVVTKKLRWLSRSFEFTRSLASVVHSCWSQLYKLVKIGSEKKNELYRFKLEHALPGDEKFLCPTSSMHVIIMENSFRQNSLRHQLGM